MLLTLEPLQAESGDCLLLHWGTLAEPKLAIIDGGPGNVYDDTLLPRLEEIRSNRALAQLTIDLVMVSHIDNDHVVGIKKLFQRLKDEVANHVGGAQRHFTVRRLWHNTFNDILGDDVDRYYQKLTASLQAAVGGQPSPQLLSRLADAYKDANPANPEPDAAVSDVALILAGHADGRALRDSFQLLFDNHEIAALNTPFRETGRPTLVMRGGPTQPLLAMPPVSGLNLTVVGPMQPELQALQAGFDEFIARRGLVEASLLAAYTDEGVPNLSSIVCLAELGGKRILLTGDARGDKIMAGLRDVGLLDGSPLHVDILKMPHHGSDRNVAQDFFEHIIAETYVFTGDGSFGNPERNTLTWLTDARGKDARYDVVLTYPVADIDARRKAFAAAHNQPWDPATNALSTFFDARQQAGFKFTLRASAPGKINLGDESPPW
jgi:hypothetical protein